MNRAHRVHNDTTSVYAPFDICVLGAGPAGISAAVAAARLGKKVCIIEKYGFAGGAAVAGLSGTICGLYSSGKSPEQIVFGFAEEFHSRLKQRGGAYEAVLFGNTKLVPHDSLQWKMVADEYIRSENIHILYHTSFIQSVGDDPHSLKSILLFGPQGLFSIEAQSFIDATGDACLIHSLGLETSYGKEGEIQTPTMIFKMAGVDMDGFLSLGAKEIEKKIVEIKKRENIDLPREHIYIFPSPNHEEVLCNMTRITLPDGSVPSPLQGDDMTYSEMEGRLQAQNYASFLKKYIPCFKNAYLVDTAAEVGIRQSRTIFGKGYLRNEDVYSAKKHKGAASISAWPIESHGAGELKIVSLEDDYYSIPFEVLIPVKAPSNVLVAGRCMAAEHEALASARVTAQCFGLGYSAGAAAALMLDNEVKNIDLTSADVDSWMKENKLKTVQEL